MTRKKFYRLAATWQAFIGLPSGVEPSAEAVQEFLESCEHVEKDFIGGKYDKSSKVLFKTQRGHRRPL